MLPHGQHATVDREKITEYLLSVSNPRGRTKATFFLGFGFNIDQWQDFATALRLHGASHDVVKVVKTPYGSRYYVDGTIETPDGRDPQVRTVWQVDVGSDYPRLITAHPIRR